MARKGGLGMAQNEPTYPSFGLHSCISGTNFLPFYVVSTRFFGLALGFHVLPSVLCLLTRRAGRSWGDPWLVSAKSGFF